MVVQRDSVKSVVLVSASEFGGMVIAKGEREKERKEGAS